MQSRTPRKGEIDTPPVRKERVFRQGEEWFFQTREGAAIGPYNSENAAAKGLANFIDFVQLASPETRARLIQSLQEDARAKSASQSPFHSGIA